MLLVLCEVRTNIVSKDITRLVFLYLYYIYIRKTVDQVKEQDVLTPWYILTAEENNF